MLEALVARDLYHAALRREIASQDDEAAGRLDRIADGADDLLSPRLRSVQRFLSQRLPGYVQATAVDQPGIDQAPGQQSAAARRVIIGGDILPARLQIAEQRSLIADPIE